MEGITALLGSDNGSRYRGVSQLQSHQSRYSVQLGMGVTIRLEISERKSRRSSEAPWKRSQSKLWNFPGFGKACLSPQFLEKTQEV